MPNEERHPLPQLTPDQIEEALSHYDSERPPEEAEEWRTDERYVYFVSTRDRLYPVKAIAALAAGRNSTVGFNSQEARRRLAAAGYQIVEREHPANLTGYWWVNQGSTFQKES